MTNIWAQTFEEIRKPHFEMEDPYTKLEEGKAKRDYDGDGKIDEYFDHRNCQHAWGDVDGDGDEECLICGVIKPIE